MFFIGIFGSSAKIVPVCSTPPVQCPCCGRQTSLSLLRSYHYLHAFFIPLKKYRQQYFATCPHCASTFEMDTPLGASCERGEATQLSPDALRLAGRGRTICAVCGESVPGGNQFCGRCGAKKTAG